MSSRRTIEERFWAKVYRAGPHLDKMDTPCWMWTAGRNRRGYGTFQRERPLRAHRVSWEIENGGIPDGKWVLHHCDNPSCVRPGHLFLGTHKDNMHNRSEKGRQARGERVGRAILSDAAVREIRRRYAAGGVLQQSLGDEFGVSQSMISRICRRDAWTHLPEAGNK